MPTQENAALSTLTDFGKTVADAADDIRGRQVKDKDSNDRATSGQSACIVSC